MTNPTLEQVEAARAEYDRSEDMCAALVAAAGAAPQEPEEVHDCTGVAAISEVENLKRLLDTQRQRGDFWERRYKEAAQLADTKLPAVTRVTLAGRTGVRSAEHWDYAGVELVVQDDGRTLKVLPLPASPYRRNGGEKE